MKYEETLQQDSRITILALSWRDIESPTAGGAEVHTHELLKRANHNKFRIIHLAAMYEGLEPNKVIDGVQYLRKGSVLSVIWYAWKYYTKNKDKIDIVIEQCNTHRFFAPIWVEQKKRIFYIHQLTREIWDINLKFPFSTIGKIMETPLLKINKNDYTIALSPSTKQDLIDVGFQEEKIEIIPVGMNFLPWEKEQFKEKEKEPTFIYAGRYAKYKGIDYAIEAFGMLKEKYPMARLWLIGKRDDAYIQERLVPICKQYGLKWSNNPEETGDIISWGFVNEDKKLELISRAQALLFPSIREGWGIPITEAAMVGTPSIVFDSPGLRDAVNMGRAGYLCKENSAVGLKEMMIKTTDSKESYEEVKEKAYQFSKQFQWENSDMLLEEFIKKQFSGNV